MEARCLSIVKEILETVPNYVPDSLDIAMQGETDYHLKLDKLGIDATIDRKFSWLSNAETFQVQFRCGTEDNYNLYGKNRGSFPLGDLRWFEGPSGDIIKSRAFRAVDYVFSAYEVGETGMFYSWCLIDLATLIKKFRRDWIGNFTPEHSNIIEVSKVDKSGRKFCWIRLRTLIEKNLLVTGKDGYPMCDRGSYNDAMKDDL